MADTLPFALENPKSAAAIVQYLNNHTPTDFWQVGVGSSGKAPEAEYMKAAWPEARIIGFEPDPRNLQTQKAENYPGELVEAACWNHNGEQPFYSRPVRSGSGLVPRLTDNDEPPEKIQVRTLMLDTFAAKLDPLPGRIVLWADCEGSELEALRGASRLLEANKIIAINVECCRPGVFKGGPTPEHIHRFLTGYGFIEQGRSLGSEDVWDATYLRL